MSRGRRNAVTLGLIASAWTFAAPAAAQSTGATGSTSSTDSTSGQATSGEASGSADSASSAADGGGSAMGDAGEGSTSSVDVFSEGGPSSNVGDLDPACSAFQPRARCAFTPAETRNYVVDVIARQCVAAQTAITGLPQVTVIARRIQLDSDCRIAEGRTRLAAGTPVTIGAVSRAGHNKLTPIRIDVRKN